MKTTKKSRAQSLMITGVMSLGLALVSSCAPAGPTQTKPSATPTPSATASPTPQSPPQSTPQPTATPTATVTAIPTPVSTSDLIIAERTTFNGKIYDDSHFPLEDVTITAKSLNSAIPYSETTMTRNGNYTFNAAPSGVELAITASKPGFTTRRRTEVLKSNKQGDPNANRYDFGTEIGDRSEFGVAYNALSDKPEVVSVSPGRNAYGIERDTSFTLTFSEPMEHQTVEENFGIWAGSSEILSVDDPVDPLSGDFTFVSGDTNEPGSGTLVWDENGFDISWSNDDKTVTFTFKDENQLPTDKDSANVPDYLVSLSGVDDGQIKDLAGISRSSEEGHFKLSEGDFENAYKFSTRSDTVKPALTGIEVRSRENGNSEGDDIRVDFSEPMIYYTAAGEIHGDMGGQNEEQNPGNPQNYFVSVDGGAEYNWESFGTVIFNTSDRNHKVVLLRLNDSSTDLWNPGQKVHLRILTTVVDPAGNTLQTNRSTEDDTAS